MKALTVFFLTLFWCLQQLAMADIIASDQYDFLEANPLKATIGAGIIHPGPITYRDFKLSVRNRRIVGFLQDRSLKLRFFPAEDTQTLAVIIAGLGGDDMSNVANFYASELQTRGISAVIIPNTLTKNFSISSSQNGLVGTVAKDSQDVYKVIELIKAKFRKEGRVFSQIRLIGYSHGALLAAYVHEMDRQRNELNVIDSLLINPPVDLLYGVRTLDGFSASFKQIPLKHKAALLLKVGVQFLKHKRYKTTATTQANFISRLSDQRQDNEGLIGKILMSSLNDSILASQYVTDLHILPSPSENETDDELSSSRRLAIKKLNFEGYVETFFRALYLKEGHGFSLEELNHQNSLYRLEGLLKQDPTIHVMHNQDDFLLKKGDDLWLEGVLGPRVKLFPRGGHMGNVWFPDNLGFFQKWVETGKF